MKPIELSEDHKSKLLEMCNKLFPETSWHFWESEDDNYPSNQMLGYNQHFTLGKHKEMQPSLEIHWFEFCFRYIIPKFKEYRIDINYWLMTLNPEHMQWPKEYNHPIDYLYDEFKKLK